MGESGKRDGAKDAADEERSTSAPAEAPESGAGGRRTEAADSAADGREANDPASARTPDAASDPLAETRAEAARHREQLLRTAADLDNLRKRSRREIEEAHRRGADELLRTLLPVFDNLERAVLHAEQATDAKAIADGVRMVLRQFVDTLERVGIKRVPSVGSPFDPLVHEAIQQIETTEQPAGTVIAEVAPGYKHGDRLVRAAMVVVAKPPPSGSKPAPRDES